MFSFQKDVNQGANISKLGIKFDSYLRIYTFASIISFLKIDKLLNTTISLES